MKIRFVIALALLATASSLAAEPRKFSASSVPAAGLKKPGRVVITNDAKSITAYRFFGDIREALVSLRSTRILGHAFGNVVYDASASSMAPKHLAPVIEEAARQHGVDPRLVAAVARRESAFNPNAVSQVGACGVMQLMPSTAKYLGVRNVFDARENIFGGTRYLRTLLDTFDGDLDLALAAYNAGPGAVQKYRGVPPYRETRAYVAAVRASYERSIRSTTPTLR